MARPRGVAAAAAAAAMWLPRSTAAPFVHQHNWCEHARNKGFSLDRLGWDGDIRELLAGETLSAVALQEEPWAVHDAGASGTCGDWCVVNSSWPSARHAGAGAQLSGIDISIMEKVARAGRFKVEYYHADLWTDSWTDMLLGTDNHSGLIDEYDLVAGGGWIDTADRRQKGVQFTAGVNDQGMVLAVKKGAAVKRSVWDYAWYWVRPFTWDAYLAVLLTWAFPASLIWAIEYANNPDFQGVTPFVSARTIARRSLLNIIGFGDFEWPSQVASRAIMALWATMILILLSTYTANMTAFLVTQTQYESVVNSIDEFIAKEHIACLPKGFGANDPVIKKFGRHSPPLRYRDDIPLGDVMKHVSDGVKCQGTIMPKDYLDIMLAGGPPRTSIGCGAGAASPDPSNSGYKCAPRATSCVEYGCQLKIVGGTLIPLSGAFPAGRSNERNCRWMLVQVLNIIIRSLSEDDILPQVFSDAKDAVSKDENGKRRCPLAEENKLGTDRISAEHLVGILIVGLSPMVAVFIFGMIGIRRENHLTQIENRQMESDAVKLMEQAKTLFTELDTNASQLLDASEVEKLADLTLRQDYAAGLSTRAAGSRTDTLTEFLLRRCKRGHEMDWEEFSACFKQYFKLKGDNDDMKLLTDPLAYMRSCDPTANARTGQVMAVLEGQADLHAEIGAMRDEFRRAIRMLSGDAASPRGTRRSPRAAPLPTDSGIRVSSVGGAEHEQGGPLPHSVATALQAERTQ